MPFSASRGFALGLFACVYGVAKWSDSKETRYIAVIISIMLLLATYLIKWWHKRQQRISSDPLSLPGPRPTDAQRGNLAELAKCGSMNEFIKRLSHLYGPIGAFYWGGIRIAYIASDSVLDDAENQPILSNLDTRPFLLYQGLKPLVGIHSVQFANNQIYHAKMSTVFRRLYGQTNMHKLVLQQYRLLQSVKFSTWKTDESAEIDVESELFSFVTKSIFCSIFGDEVVKDKSYDSLVTQVMQSYHQCFDEMEQRLVHAKQPDDTRNKKFETALKTLKHGITQILDKRASSQTTSKSAAAANLVDLFTANGDIYPDRESVQDDIITMMHTVYKTHYGILWTLYFVAKHGKVQMKMVDEISRVFGDMAGDDEKNEAQTMLAMKDENDCKRYLQKLKELKYCRNVMMETLRITSIISWTARVSKDSEIVLRASSRKKVRIAAGMPIVIGLGAMNTEKKRWENPTVFDPDRFSAKEDKDENAKNAANVFGGVGNRMCPGQQFFECQNLMFMVHVLSRYELSLKKTTTVDANQLRPFYGLVTKPNQNIALVVSKRKFATL